MSGGNPPPAPAVWKMPGMDKAANQGFGAIQGLSSMPNYAQGAAQGSGDVANGSTGWDPSQTVAYGNQISDMSQHYLPYADQIMQMGFDPQNEYYGRAAHDLTEQVRAGEAARGIEMSPYGAGVENRAMSDFNIDWQNNRLGRATQAYGAAMPGWQMAGNQIGQGQSLAMAAPQAQSGLWSNYANTGNSAYAQPSSVIDSWMNYVGAGNNANSVGNQTYANQLQAWNDKQHANDAVWQGLGQLAGSAASAAKFASSPEWKENIEGIFDEDIIKAFAGVHGYAYDYTPESGYDDGLRHTGPMADEWAGQFGGDGKVIPMPQMMGAAIAVLGALSRKVDRLAA